MKVTSDFTKDVLDFVKSFKRDIVLVGVPEQKGPREDGAISNAAIMAINEFGSPANNIPPRPAIEIGIRYSTDRFTAEFKKAAIAILSKGKAGAALYYNRAGSIAANEIKATINNQVGILEPSLVTLQMRRDKGFKGEKALIVTGQLRNSITWVLNEDA